MRKISLYILIAIFTMLISTMLISGVVSYASEEISVSSITKVNAEGESVPYDESYSRDVSINYSFQGADSFVVKTYVKGVTGFVYSRTSDVIKVVDGKGSYKVLDEGEVRVDCIAKDIAGFEIETKSTVVLSDVTKPSAPQIDIDGAMDETHSTEFSVSYQIGYDALSGVDFSRSTYTYEDSEGNVIKEGALQASYDKALISGINQNGTLTLMVYDKAGNFVLAKKSYDKHYYVNSSAPTITVTPENGYSKNVMVTINWPVGVSYKYYKVIVDGVEQAKKAYTAPFSLTDEGTVMVLAYYYEGGKESYVTKKITNVDKTGPNDESIRESIRVIVDLRSSTPAKISLRVRDALSGISKVYIKGFGTEFTRTDLNVYEVDATQRLGTTVTIVAVDNAGNQTEFTYSLTGYDRNKIEYYSSTYRSLNVNAYDESAWNALLNAYDRLSNLMTSQNSASGTIQTYAQEVDSAIEGKHQVSVTLKSVIDGLSNDFEGEVAIGATTVKKGGKINLLIDKVSLSEGELTEKMTIGATIAKFPAYEGFAFNIALTDSKGAPITVINQYSVSLTIPGVNKLAKVYYDNGGTITQLSSTIENGIITFNAEGGGNFYFIVEKELEEEQGKGLTIAGKFYPMNLLLIAGGIILGAIILVGVLTPIIYKVVKDKKLSGKKFNYLR